MPRVLSLLAATGALLLAAPAFAADAVSLWIPGPVAANGQPVQVQLWSAAFDPAAKVKLTVGGQKLADFDLSQPGLLAFRYTPPADGAAASVPLTVQIQGPKGNAEASLSLDLAPAATAPLQITFDPPILAFGTDSAAKVWVQPPAGAQDLGSRRFSVHSSAGVIDTLTPVGDGRYVARWTPPAKLPDAQVVLFMVSEDNRPGEVFGAAALPVSVSTAVTVEAPPASTSLLEAGGRRYGPLAADSKGSVTFKVAVDPRDPRGQLEVVHNGQKSSRSVDLPIAAGPRLTFSPPPAGLPANPALSYPVVLFGLSAGGRALEAAPGLAVDRGSLGPVRAGSLRGSFVADYQPPAEAGPVQFTATLGELVVQRDSRLVAAPAAPVARLSVSPETLDLDTKEITLTATLKTAAGQAVTGRPPELGLSGLKLVGKPVDQGDGSYLYRATLTEGPVMAALLPDLAPTGLPAAHLLAWTVDPAVAPGAGTALMVAVTDDFGHGVPDVDLVLRTVGGAAPATARTGSRGLAWLPLSLGKDGPAQISVEGAGLRARTLLLPSPPDRDRAPLVGSAADQALLARWVAMTDAVRPVSPLPAAPAPSPLAATVGGPAAPADPLGAAAPPEAGAPAAAPAPASGLSVRLDGAVGGGRHSYDLAAEASPDVPATAAFTTGGLLSVPLLDARATVAFNETWAADVRARLWTEQLNVRATEQVGSGSVDFAAGVRYGLPVLDFFSAYGLGQVHSVTTPAFTYANAPKTELAVERARRFGLKIGAGGILTVGPVHARLELSETFMAAPSVHALDSEVSVKVLDPLAVRLGFAAEARNLRLVVADTDADVKDSLTALTLGVTWLLP